MVVEEFLGLHRVMDVLVLAQGVPLGLGQHVPRKPGVRGQDQDLGANDLLNGRPGRRDPALERFQASVDLDGAAALAHGYLPDCVESQGVFFAVFPPICVPSSDVCIGSYRGTREPTAIRDRSRQKKIEISAPPTIAWRNGGDRPRIEESFRVERNACRKSIYLYPVAPMSWVACPRPRGHGVPRRRGMPGTRAPGGRVAAALHAHEDVGMPPGPSPAASDGLHC